MDPKELRGLVEAYQQIYAPQEEIEEAVKGESSERRKDLAAERRAGIKPLSAKEGERYASHKMAQMAYAKRKRMGEEVEEVDEAVKGADPEMRRAAAAERKAGDKPLSKKVGDAHAANMARKIRFSDKVTKAKGHIPGYTYAEDVEQVDELYKGKHGQSETEYQDSRSNAGKMVSGTSKLSGAAYSSRGVKNSGPNPAGGSQRPQAQGRMTSGQRTELQYRKANLKKEDVDIFDIVLEFLQAEGYVETLEQAEWMMANVIDEEAIDIILGEAQHARENPEKYERDQEKRTSKREKAMNDPHKGINSPAFAEFMRKQMGR